MSPEKIADILSHARHNPKPVDGIIGDLRNAVIDGIATRFNLALIEEGWAFNSDVFFKRSGTRLEK